MLNPGHRIGLITVEIQDFRLSAGVINLELEARLEKLERAGNGTAVPPSEKNPKSAGAPARELTGAGKPQTPSHPAAYAKKAASQA